MKKALLVNGSPHKNGNTAAVIDRLNQCFTFAEIPVIAGNYRNVVLNSGNDEYGTAAVTKLAENMPRFLPGESVR